MKAGARRVAQSLALTWLLWAYVGRADGSRASDPVAAQVYFERGRIAMTHGDPEAPMPLLR